MSSVFFADLRATSKKNLLDKVDRLFDQAGLNEIIKPKELVALKVHFGERGNMAYIRPQFIRRIVKKVREAGGKPFLTDSNTLYRGSRANAVDHLETALENGFAYAVVNAPLVIADGLTGKDYVSVPINQKHFKEVKIGSAAYHADTLIAITHFKGHEATGFGGTLKNIGMGFGCRSGKQMMHSDILPRVTPEKCLACGRCTEWCPADAISVGDYAIIDEKKCLGCGECTVTCPEAAIEINWKSEPDLIQEKIVEYTLGILQNKKGKAGFITFLTNISPNCDCWPYNDLPIVNDIGILASRDPIAIDQASIDLVNRQQVQPGSCLAEMPLIHDKFRALYQNVDWSIQLAYGEKLGLGSRKYNLIKI